MVRVVPYYEKKQRGCQYCLHTKHARDFHGIRTGCPFAECPFEVLDKYESYEAFMASEDSKILVDEFFTNNDWSVALTSNPNTPKKIFSDGDGKVGL